MNDFSLCLICNEWYGSRPVWAAQCPKCARDVWRRPWLQEAGKKDGRWDKEKQKNKDGARH